jgi:ribosomal protein S18 acetylase RimI-like enzyme
MPFVLQRSWVGRRVSVRRVLDRDPDGRLALGDVVGDLVGLDDQTAAVETRNGLVEVPLPLITVARLVPASTADELALDEIGARALRPAQTEELDGWRLRADHGYTDRANSVLPLRQLRMPLDEALGRAHDWYAERGLPVRIHVSVEARRLLDAGLGERGWHPGPDVHVMTARLDQLRRAPEPDGRVQVHDAPDDDWLALYRGGSGLTQTGRALLARHDRAGFATLRLDGRAVAVGRATVDDEWLGVMAVEVDPAYRRQGLAGAVMAALTGWGAAHGARRSYLQVYADNQAAVALYEDLGYWVHHDYRYRTEP